MNDLEAGTFVMMVKNDDGSFSGFLIAGTNITARKQSERDLLIANRKLQMLSSITSHDILNQVTALAVLRRGRVRFLDRQREVNVGGGHRRGGHLRLHWRNGDHKVDRPSSRHGRWSAHLDGG